MARKTRTVRKTRKTAKKRTARLVQRRPEPWMATLAEPLPASSTLEFGSPLAPDVDVNVAGATATIGDASLATFLKAVRLCVSGVDKQEDGTVFVDCTWGECNCMPGLYDSLQAFEHQNSTYNRIAREAVDELKSAWRRMQAKTLMKLGYGHELTVFVCKSGPQIAIRKPRVRAMAKLPGR